MHSNVYLDSMPLEYRARVLLERRSPCSGIAEPSLHVFQRRGMVKKVIVPDSLKGGGGGGGGGGASAPGDPPVPPPMSKRKMALQLGMRVWRERWEFKWMSVLQRNTVKPLITDPPKSGQPL